MATYYQSFNYSGGEKEEISDRDLRLEIFEIRNQIELLTNLCKSVLIPTEKEVKEPLFSPKPPAYRRTPNFTPLNLSPCLSLGFFHSEKDKDVRYDLPNLWSIIPAGGSGTRLWPLSRDKTPKFLLDLEGKGKSLIQNTIERVNVLNSKKNIVIVTGKFHQQNIIEQLQSIPKENILCEPNPKDSMAALAFATFEIYSRDKDAIIASFPADHLIQTENDENFYLAVIKAYEIAKQSNDLITIGLQPSFASTGFGYIEMGNLMENKNVFKVNSFKEKPDQDTANEFLQSGNYVWNAGMFVCKAESLIKMLQEHHSELYDGIVKLQSAATNENFTDIWSKLPSISIDHAIAEPVAAQGRMVVVCTNLDWKDVGDFASLAEVHQTDNGDMVHVLGNNELVKSTNSSGFIVPSSKRLIACHGVQDIVIIDTPDALLVTTTAEAQNIKGLVKKCKNSFINVA